MKNYDDTKERFENDNKLQDNTGGLCKTLH